MICVGSPGPRQAAKRENCPGTGSACGACHAWQSKAGEVIMARGKSQDDKAKKSEDGNSKMPRKEYEKALHKLQVELCHLQAWVKEKGVRAIIIFEGRDAAGKGGTIKAISERVSPRVFRVVALPAPSDRQKSQMFMQRCVEQFPAAGRIR